MPIKSVALALMSCALAVFVTAGQARETASTTQFYSAPGPRVPALADDYLRKHPREQLEVRSFTVIGKPTVQSFFAQSEVLRSASGVCRYTITQVFPHRGDGGKIAWDGQPADPAERASAPAAMGVIAAAPCPPPVGNAYIALNGGVSDEEFADVFQFWKTIAREKDEFDRASSYLPFILSEDAAAKFAAFRAALFGGQAMPALRAIWKDGPDTYDLTFGASVSEAPSAFLSLSKSDAGFQLVNFQTAY